eukprot:TRINITY_DN1654_c0_g1_i4.p1 TRINITY_DN1654_c0_g1~~TRINITY_DN1654_c0_g1_i4.p1  ORF type:complete len:433 (-),score=29.35 TRINITY_DN1654_c0_g1_i4:140-1438(-)
MIRRPPRSTQGVSSAASDVYKRQVHGDSQSDMEASTQLQLQGKNIDLSREDIQTECLSNTLLGSLKSKIHQKRYRKYNDLMSVTKKHEVVHACGVSLERTRRSKSTKEKAHDQRINSELMSFRREIEKKFSNSCANKEYKFPRSGTQKTIDKKEVHIRLDPNCKNIIQFLDSTIPATTRICIGAMLDNNDKIGFNKKDPSLQNNKNSSRCRAPKLNSEAAVSKVLKREKSYPRSKDRQKYSHQGEYFSTMPHTTSSNDFSEPSTFRKLPLLKAEEQTQTCDFVERGTNNAQDRTKNSFKEKISRTKLFDVVSSRYRRLPAAMESIKTKDTISNGKNTPAKSTNKGHFHLKEKTITNFEKMEMHTTFDKSKLLSTLCTKSNLERTPTISVLDPRSHASRKISHKYIYSQYQIGKSAPELLQRIANLLRLNTVQ